VALRSVAGMLELYQPSAESVTRFPARPYRSAVAEMASSLVGELQTATRSLGRLLGKIEFRPEPRRTLYVLGDLVNRGTGVARCGPASWRTGP
jgi:hypothetical protein